VLAHLELLERREASTAVQSHRRGDKLHHARRQGLVLPKEKKKKKRKR
jgi:hypothetical protein